MPLRRQIDFTQGDLTGQIVLFAIPLVLSELLQNLYNSVDALVVGNFVSGTALAAISVCSNLSNLLISFFNGMSIGAVVIVSRSFGSKQEEALRRTMRVCFTFSAMLGVALSLIGITFTDPLVRLSAVNDAIHAEAVTYLRIYLAGLMFTVIYNVSAGMLRAVGDSSTPFYILLTTSVLNILLDLVFVAWLHLGIAGVSIATVISQFASVALVCARLTKHIGERCFSLEETFRGGGPVILDLLGIGAPSGLQGALISFSNLFVWRYVGPFGEAATAGIGVAQRVDKFVVMPCKALGSTATTCVSQNLGARNPERARAGVWRCLWISLGTLAVLEFVGYVFAGRCVALFNGDSEIIAVGEAMLHTIIPLYAVIAFREILYGILRGHGYAKVTTVLALIGMVGIRQLFLAVTMNARPVIENIFWCYPVAWFSTLILIAGYYFIFIRRRAFRT